MSEWSSQVARTVRYAPLGTQGVFIGLSVSHLWVLSVAALVVITAVQTSGPVGMLLSLPLWLPLVIVGTVRVHRIPMPIFLRNYGVFMFRHLTGATSHRYRPEAERLEGSLNLPGRRAALQVWESGEGGAVVYDQFERTISITAEIEVEGFMLLDDAGRRHAVDSWATVLGSFTKREGVLRVAMQERTVPVSTEPARAAFDVARGRATTGQDVILVKSYQAVLDQVEGFTVAHQNYLTITLSLGARGGEVKALGGGRRGAVALGAQEMQNVTDALREQSFRVRRWLNARQWAALGRVAFDPEFASQIADRTGTAAGVSLDAIGPMAVDESPSKAHLVRTDSGVHTTMWIHEWPRTDVVPGFVHPVVFAQRPHDGQAVSHMFTIVCSPVKVQKALQAIEREKNTWQTNMTAKQTRGRSMTAADEADWQALVEQERSIVLGHGKFMFSGYVTVSAEDEESLSMATSAMRNGMARAGLEPQILYFQQAEALFANALPAGGGMK